MDVNELIDKYQEFLELNISAVGGSVFRMSDLLNDLKELSNLEYNRKVKVPEKFDEWYKQIDYKGYNSTKKEIAVHLINRLGWGHNFTGNISEEVVYDEELRDWVYENKERATRAVLDGYEVEEEAWEVRLRFNDKEAAEAYAYAHVEYGEVVKIESC